MPLLIAIPSILTTFLLVLGLTQAISVSFLIEYLVALMGLGVAIDYSLLLITRWREGREAGRSNEDALLASAPTAGRAVVLSGATVAVGLLSLVLLPVPFLRSIGLGGMLIPLVAITAAGRHAAAGDARLMGSRARQATCPLGVYDLQSQMGVLGEDGRAPTLGRGRPRRRDRTRARRPALSMNTGQPRANSLGGSGQPAQTLHALERQGVPSGVVFPIQVLTHGGPAAVDRAGAIARATPGVYTVLAPATPAFRQGQDSLLSVVPSAKGNTSAGTATVSRLRAAMASVPGRAEVGGNTAQNVDFDSASTAISR